MSFISKSYAALRCDKGIVWVGDCDQKHKHCGILLSLGVFYTRAAVVGAVWRKEQFTMAEAFGTIKEWSEESRLYSRKIDPDLFNYHLPLSTYPPKPLNFDDLCKRHGIDLTEKELQKQGGSNG